MSWFDVETSPPVDTRWLLVTLHAGDRVPWVAIAFHRKGSGEFSEFHPAYIHGPSSPATRFHVTHWAPLPEPFPVPSITPNVSQPR